jgi:hypothetical protein
MKRKVKCCQCGNEFEVDYAKLPAGESIICTDEGCNNYCYYIDALNIGKQPLKQETAKAAEGSWNVGTGRFGSKK